MNEPTTATSIVTMNGFHHRDLSESLRLAVEQGHTERVVELLKRGAPSELDDQGQTPLHIAASAGHVELVDVLIQAGFDVTVQDYVSVYSILYPAGQPKIQTRKKVMIFVSIMCSHISPTFFRGNSCL